MAESTNNITGFNLNDVVNFIDTIQNINKSIADVVGVDLLYFRAIPHENGESVIFHEYTLLDVDCEKQIKGVVKNPDYGNGIEVDLFGVKYDSPLQIQFDLQTWNEVFGPDVMPQKDDIVYVPLLNRLFEVNTSSPIYTFINQQTAWQVDMVKYNPKASRAENPTLLDTIQQSTVSAESLFGEEISKQIADITDIKEFSPYNSVAKEGDWFKEVQDRSCIVTRDVSIRGFLISNGYYNMSSVQDNPIVVYKDSSDTLSPSSERPNRYFSCWFRPHLEEKPQHDLKNMQLYLKLKGTSQFKAYCSGNYSIGQSVLVSKGSVLRIPGTILDKNQKTGEYLIEMSTSDVLKANRKISKWHETASIKIEATGGIIYFLNGNPSFELSMLGFKNLKVKIGTFEKVVTLKSDLSHSWFGLCMNIGSESVGRIFDANGESIDSFDFGTINEEISIEEYYLNSGPVDLTNIRLYEFESPITDESSMKEDLFRTFTTNANNAIITDKAEIPNYMDYLGQIR